MQAAIIRANRDHQQYLPELYAQVAAVPDGIIRRRDEISQTYIEDFFNKSLYKGLMLLSIADEQIIGEIHAYTPDLYAFQHILTDLTIVVRPAFQGQGVGRQLFETFLNTVRMEYPHILRVELYVREHNVRNVAFYSSLGFINEGRQENKIYMGEGKFETPLHMAWFNPNYHR